MTTTHAHYSYDQLLRVNAQTDADTSREVAARAGDDNHGSDRIDFFRVVQKITRSASWITP